MKLRAKWYRFRVLTRLVGLRAALSCLWQRQKIDGHMAYWVHPQQVIHPLLVRDEASDINVLRQVFLKREYACLDDLNNVRLIIDCGANAGYSSAYFLSRHPGSHVIAVEPDPGNFATLQRNLAAFGSRAKAIQAGIWSHQVPLMIAEASYRDGREWGRQVRVCGPHETAQFDGLDVGSILAASGQQRISLLKMDIEGAEAIVFAGNCQPWLDKVDAIAIELHDDSIFGNASDLFFAAIRGAGFQVTRSGDLTICKRPRIAND